MGQYHKVANLDKRQILDPHNLGNGLKLWEQLASHPGTGAALIVLLASKSNGDGGGDLEAHPLVGSWCGDRIAFVGDYDDKSSYQVGRAKLSGAKIYGVPKGWKDISLAVAEIIERELDGKYSGDGWRDFTYNGQDKPEPHGMSADLVISAGGGVHADVKERK